MTKGVIEYELCRSRSRLWPPHKYSDHFSSVYSLGYHSKNILVNRWYVKIKNAAGGVPSAAFFYDEIAYF
jgi:hypothetical protein